MRRPPAYTDLIPSLLTVPSPTSFPAINPTHLRVDQPVFYHPDLVHSLGPHLVLFFFCF
ncbi:hypothetical protein BX600DRAFT_446233 [Xylariales sp. PMI_506]|nr:hypothetical protein BX600DRAFT_446233 [Xylariales sp. PMI_506]